MSARRAFTALGKVRGRAPNCLESWRAWSATERDLTFFLDLGVTPLANAFVVPARLDEVELRFPLEVLRCARCALYQCRIAKRIVGLAFVPWTMPTATIVHRTDEAPGSRVPVTLQKVA